MSALSNCSSPLLICTLLYIGSLSEYTDGRQKRKLARGEFTMEAGYRAEFLEVALRYGFLGFGKGETAINKDIKINQNIITLQIDAYLNRDWLSIVGNYLDVKAGLGFGISILNGSYVLKENNYKYTFTGPSFAMNYGAQAELYNLKPVTDWVTPYLRLSSDIFFDKGGLMTTYKIGLGVKTDVSRISVLWRKNNEN